MFARSPSADERGQVGELANERTGRRRCPPPRPASRHRRLPVTRAARHPGGGRLHVTVFFSDPARRRPATTLATASSRRPRPT